MTTAAQRELDAQSDINMASLTYEDGLVEIDSFFNSPPDHRSSNAGVQSHRSNFGTKDAPDRMDAEPSAHSPTQPPQEFRTIDEQDKAKDAEDEHNAGEYATLIEDLDQVTETAQAPPETNPKARLDFILNDHATSLPRSPPKTLLSQQGHETVLPDRTEAQGSQLAEIGVNAPPELAGLNIASTISDSIQASQQHTRTAPSSPTKSATPSPPDINEVTLASLIAENLGPPSSSGNRESARAVSTVHAPEQQDATQEPPPQTLVAPNEEELPVATPALYQTMGEAMSDTSAVVEKSPDIPSSEGKHSLIEEMRIEEGEARGVLSSNAGQIHRLNLSSTVQSDQLTDAESNDMNTPSLHQAIATQQILDAASHAQEKSKAAVSRTRSQEAQVEAMKDGFVGGEGIYEAGDAESTKQDQADERETNDTSKKKAHATRNLAKAMVTRARSQADKVSYQEDASVNDGTDDGDKDDQLGTEDEEELNEAVDKTQKKEADPNSSRPANINLYLVKPTSAVRPGPPKEAAQSTKTAKKPVRKKAARNSKKTSKKAPALKQPAKPVPQQRASSRRRLSTVYEEPESGEAVDEPQNERAPQPTVPAKRKPTAAPMRQSKRVKQAETSEQVQSEDSNGSLQSVGSNRPPAVRQRKSKGRNYMGGREMKELAYGFYANPTASGPRQTRGRRQEQGAEVPNPGQAAKARQKKSSA